MKRGELITPATEMSEDHRLALEQRIAELKAENERCRTLLELSEEGLIIHDQGVLIDASPGLFRMLDREPEELIGKNLIDFATPESGKVICENTAAGITGPYEITARRRDETDFPAELRTKSIVLGNQPLKGIVIRDITERK
ncbi:PAS domain-containing protein [Candidatus Microgenomates bacterium]|nr:PAS domain-containing protein [Candidatus Microgenomates bacterium]